MLRSPRSPLAWLGLLAALAGCSAEPAPGPGPLAGGTGPQAPTGGPQAAPVPDSLRQTDPPAAPGSGQPWLAVAPDGALLLSWVEPDPAGGHRLRFSRLEAEGWSEPRTVAAGDGWFVNWADVPSIAVAADGTLGAHWLVRSAAATYAYDVVLATSRDGGRTWSPPRTAHADRSAAEHGFATLVPREGGFDVLWLDGRETAGGDPMTLRSARLTRDGTVHEERLVDASVCDCCPTSAVSVPGGALLAAYRDRTAGEVRDIHTARLEGGTWSPAGAIHDDRWTVTSCPVNGPALAARDGRSAAAWFTRGDDDRPRVRVAFSDDGGRTWSEAVDAAAARPAGRVDVVLLGDGSAVASWVERGDAAGRPGAILLQRVTPDGPTGRPVTVTATSASRQSGYPRLARRGEELVVTWTEAGDPTTLRAALLPAAEVGA